MPIFAAVSVLMRLMKSFSFFIADRYQIWTVETEEDFEYEYDEGPGARRNDSLPPGMAAIDATIAECVEDAYAAGHSDETLAKLLQEAMYIPPGTSIQAVSIGGDGGSGGSGGGAGGGGGGSGGGGGLTQDQVQKFMQMQAAGMIPMGVASAAMGTVPVPMMMPSAAMGRIAMPMPMPTIGMGVMPGPMMGIAPSAMAGVPAGMGGLLASAGAPGQSPGLLPAGIPGAFPFMGAMPGALALPTGPSLPPGVPPPPAIDSGQAPGSIVGEAGEFSSFMTAFRNEIKATRDHDSRIAKFVPSAKFAADAPSEQQQIQTRADAVFGTAVGPGATPGLDDDEDFAEWPDELLILGINMDEAEDGTTSTTTTTETTQSEGEDETDDEDEDAWPLELLIAGS